MGRFKYTLLVWLIAFGVISPRITYARVFNALPGHIMVFKADYSVTFGTIVDSDSKVPLDGIIYHDKLKIEVEKKLPRGERESTLIHEILHAVSRQYQAHLTEKQVQALEKGIYETLVKNHWKVVIPSH